MKSKTNIPGITLILLLFFTIAHPECRAQSFDAEAYSADILVGWNAKVMQIAVAEDRLLTLKGVRTASMMHVAIHDAINAIHPEYTPYAFDGDAPGSDPVAAVAQAAFEVVSSQYPDKRMDLEKELQKWLDSVDDGERKTQGIALGRASANAIVEARTDDRWNGEAEYTWHPMAPGVYAEFKEHSGTPEGFVFGAGWAAAEPFMLTKQSQFRAPPPPEINSHEYTKAYNEAKEYGRTKSNSRTDDQAHLAMWWKDFVENSHNRLVREIVMSENLDLWKAARAFALMNMSIYDAYVNVFENKFHYNHWRPYTAIRWAANDGNPETAPEMDWNNLHLHTYAFPSYPSAHGSASAAAMTVLAKTLGLGDQYAFTMTTKMVDKAGPLSEKTEIDPSTRSFESFSGAALECAMSRVYLGIHFRYDSVEGNKLGTRIGNYASDNFLQPVE